MSRILMVDNAVLFQILETSFLRRVGCEIVRAASSDEVMDKARGLSPDLILLDDDHPRIDARACLLSLRSDAELRSIPVLVIGDPWTVPGSEQETAIAFVSRPLDPPALEGALSALANVARRDDSRRPARLRALVGGPTGALRCRVKNISRSGLFLSLPAPLPLRSAISVSLSLPAGYSRRPLKVRCVVVRQVPAAPESYLIPGVGVRFVELDASSESLIDRYVKQPILDDGTAGVGAAAHQEGA
jgi:CheY-like chemotaxis protein